MMNVYRNAIIQRFNKCIVSDMNNEVCEAAHIIPLCEISKVDKLTSFDIDNGILLNCVLHKLFDKHYWCINPKTLCIEICNKSPTIYDILKPYENKYIGILKQYTNVIKYLTKHYNKVKQHEISI